MLHAAHSLYALYPAASYSFRQRNPLISLKRPCCKKTLTCKAEQVGVAKDEEKGKILVRFPSSGKEDAPREDHGCITGA